MMRSLASSILLLCIVRGLWAYKIPNPIVKVYRKGFQISMPHENGTELVLFCGILNLEAAGIWCAEFTRSDEGTLWLYNNFDKEPQLGDTLYFSIYVTHSGKDYSRHNIVHSIDNYEEPITKGPGTSDVDMTTNYSIPIPTFKVFEGHYEVSIPHEEGMEYVLYRGSIRKDITGTPRQWSLIAKRDQNGSWTANSHSLHMRLGSVVKYTVQVKKNGKTYQKKGLTFNVDETMAEAPGADYNIPTPSFIAQQSNFKVSIPHEDGIESVLYRGSIHAEGRTQTWCIKAKLSKSGHWTARNRRMYMFLGTIVKCHVVVKKNRKYYIKEDVTFTVVNPNGAKAKRRGAPDADYNIPTPKFRVYQQRYEVSIPHEGDIESVHFYGSIRAEGVAPRKWMVKAKHGRNGCWTASLTHYMTKYVHCSAKYFVVVRKDGRDYKKDNLTFTLENFNRTDVD